MYLIFIFFVVENLFFFIKCFIDFEKIWMFIKFEMILVIIYYCFEFKLVL